MNNRLFIIALGLAGIVAIVFIVRNSESSLPGLSGDGIASFVYMSVWGTLIASAIVTSRQPIGQSLKQIVIWIGIFLVVMAGYTHRYELQDFASTISGGLVPGSPISSVGADGREQITLIRNASRHFIAHGEIEDNPITFLVDTGATDIVLSNEDAAGVGIDVANLRYTNPVSTANGLTTTARTKVRSISIGPIRYRNITVMVSRKGDLDGSLLGMNFINRLHSFEIRGDRMILTK